MTSQKKHTRRRFLQQAGIGLTGITMGSQAPAIIHKQRPNILLIMSDQEQSGQDLPSDLPLPQNVRHQDLNGLPDMHRRYVEFCDYFYGSMPRDDLDLWRKFRSYYFNCIRDVDHHLGTVLDALDSAKLKDNTIVVYTSDHGELAGAHGLRQKGPFIYKENLRVPLILRHPDLVGGGQRSEPTSAVDLVPTLFGLAGGRMSSPGIRS
jgi:hypothetical protein